MPHQDQQDVRTNLQALKAVFSVLLPPEAEEFERHGNAKISPAVLVATAITCWGWTNHGTLDDRIASAAAVVKRMFRIDHVGTRQGVMNALVSCGDGLVQTVVRRL